MGQLGVGDDDHGSRAHLEGEDRAVGWEQVADVLEEWLAGIGHLEEVPYDGPARRAGRVSGPAGELGFFTTMEVREEEGEGGDDEEEEGDEDEVVGVVRGERKGGGGGGGDGGGSEIIIHGGHGFWGSD